MWSFIERCSIALIVERVLKAKQIFFFRKPIQSADERKNTKVILPTLIATSEDNCKTNHELAYDICPTYTLAVKY